MKIGLLGSKQQFAHQTCVMHSCLLQSTWSCRAPPDEALKTTSWLLACVSGLSAAKKASSKPPSTLSWVPFVLKTGQLMLAISGLVNSCVRHSKRQQTTLQCATLI